MSAATPLSEDSTDSRPLAGILLSTGRARAALGLRPNAAGGGFAAAPAFAAQTQAGARASPISQIFAVLKPITERIRTLSAPIRLRGIFFCLSVQTKYSAGAPLSSYPILLTIT